MTAFIIPHSSFIIHLLCPFLPTLLESELDERDLAQQIRCGYAAQTAPEPQAFASAVVAAGPCELEDQPVERNAAGQGDGRALRLLGPAGIEPILAPNIKQHIEIRLMRARRLVAGEQLEQVAGSEHRVRQP